MIKAFKTVYIGKGKNTLEFTPDESNRDDILKAAMGRSGNLRAPTIKTPDGIYIGFNEEIYKGL